MKILLALTLGVLSVSAFSQNLDRNDPRANYECTRQSYNYGTGKWTAIASSTYSNKDRSTRPELTQSGSLERTNCKFRGY